MGWAPCRRVSPPEAYLWGCAWVLAVCCAQLVHRCILPAPHGTDVCQLLLPVQRLPAGLLGLHVLFLPCWSLISYTGSWYLLPWLPLWTVAFLSCRICPSVPSQSLGGSVVEPGSHLSRNVDHFQPWLRVLWHIHCQPALHHCPLMLRRLGLLLTYPAPLSLVWYNKSLVWVIPRNPQIWASSGKSCSETLKVSRK